MSTLLEYLDEAEKIVEQWPEWKLKSIRDAFQLPKINNDNIRVFEDHSATESDKHLNKQE